MLAFVQICAVWRHCMSRAIRERETDRFGEHVFEGIQTLDVFEQQTYVLHCSHLMDLMLHDATKGSSLQRCLHVVQLKII